MKIEVGIIFVFLNETQEKDLLFFLVFLGICQLR